MNWLSFIASIVGTMVWPALIAWVVWFISRNGQTLKSLVESVREYLKTVKVGNLEVTFQDARKKAETLANELGQPLEKVTTPDKLVAQVANNDANSAIVVAWIVLEDKLDEMIATAGLSAYVRPDNVMVILFSRNQISENDLQLYWKLQTIRNDAIHSRHQQNITVSEALEFSSFVATLIRKLDKVTLQPYGYSKPNEQGDSGSVHSR